MNDTFQILVTKHDKNTARLMRKILEHNVYETFQQKMV